MTEQGERDLASSTLELSDRLRAILWELPRDELLVACLEGRVDPGFLIAFSRRPFDVYLRHPRRFVDMRYVDMARATPQTADLASQHREKVPDREELSVILVRPGLAYGLAKVYQAYSEFRGRKLEIASSVEEAARLLEVDLSWYEPRLASLLSRSGHRPPPPTAAR